MMIPASFALLFARGHVRVFASQGDTEGTRTLADYAITRHYPEAAQAERPCRAFLDLTLAQDLLTCMSANRVDLP